MNINTEVLKKDINGQSKMFLSTLVEVKSGVIKKDGSLEKPDTYQIVNSIKMEDNSNELKDFSTLHNNVLKVFLSYLESKSLVQDFFKLNETTFIYQDNN